MRYSRRSRSFNGPEARDAQPPSFPLRLLSLVADDGRSAALCWCSGLTHENKLQCVQVNIPYEANSEAKESVVGCPSCSKAPAPLQVIFLVGHSSPATFFFVFRVAARSRLFKQFNCGALNQWLWRRPGHVHRWLAAYVISDYGANLAVSDK